MDIAKGLTFITEDEEYIRKLAIGVGLILISSLLSIVLVGILGFFILAGYGLRLLENVRDGVEKPLPEWDDWGGDLSRGFKYMIVTIIWAIPIFHQSDKIAESDPVRIRRLRHQRFGFSI